MKLDKPFPAVVASTLLSLVLLDCGQGSGGGGGSFSSIGGSVSGVGGGSTGGSGGGITSGIGGEPSSGVGGVLGMVIDTSSSAGGSAEPGVCDDVDFEITGRVVDMLIVLDRSLSMRDSGLWLPMGTALTNVTAATETGVDFGLATLPFTDDECAPGNILLGITEPSAAAIADVVGGGRNDVATSVGTPTAETLRVARAYLDTVTDGRDKFVLLATDGAPNCNPTLDGSTCVCSIEGTGGGNRCDPKWCLDDVATAAAAAELYAAGYPVFVLGIGESMAWETVMNAIAMAGGTGQYIPADSDEFEAVLLGIVGGIMSCEFELDWASLSDTAVRDPSMVNLYCKQNSGEANSGEPVTGNAIPRNDNCAYGGIGWTWSDSTNSTIGVCPDTCAAIREGGCPVISATFGCESITVR